MKEVVLKKRGGGMAVLLLVLALYAAAFACPLLFQHSSKPLILLFHLAHTTDAAATAEHRTKCNQSSRHRQ